MRNGQSNLERTRHCRLERHGGRRRHSLFPPRFGGSQPAARKRLHEGVFLEGNGALLHALGEWARQRERGLVLSRSEAGGTADQEPGRVLEGGQRALILGRPAKPRPRAQQPPRTRWWRR